MKKFKLLNNVTGWAVFAIAAFTYLSTIEPTASFWDCGEFITSVFKLEVGHPPGAPFFMILARFFTLFASSPLEVAAMVNAYSALASAFTILFLFWTITYLAKKTVEKFSETQTLTLGQGIAILGSGVVGALAYTWSDTFWFSAVEGEVYASSSFFTALVVWAMLKWDAADSISASYANRWIIFIAYVMGLSIGVHLLNLLAIPALVLVYYYKKYEVTPKHTLIALVTSVILLVAVLYGMIPGFMKVAKLFELLFVNGFNLPYNSGTLVYGALLFIALAWAIYETQVLKNTVRARVAVLIAFMMTGVTFFGNSYFLGIVILIGLGALLYYKKDWNYTALNTIMLCMTMILFGYSTFALNIIRSNANTPMDQNSPEDVFSLQSYLNREQYGDRPLFYGAYYSAPDQLKVKGNNCIPIKTTGRSMYERVEENADTPDHYINIGKKTTGYKKDPRFCTLFPRMYSTKERHIAQYKHWANIKNPTQITVDQCGRDQNFDRPSFVDNLRFFFNYQVDFMYMRYFFWNFAGRQNDLQSSGELDHGNWLTGIPFIDSARLGGNQAQLNQALENNKGHNNYYMLPLLLGIIGLLWQLKRGKHGKHYFWFVFTVFFMTGLAIVIYLNQTPLQPRERDYAYAGSFYAFAIWIGLGVMGLYALLKKSLGDTSSALIAGVLCVLVPVQMLGQTWDDHDRSDRTMARDMGYNYLISCNPNGIYFCNGDNDTFPVWYNQEVEGNRTDLRACNLSYLNMDWYIDQMRRQAYTSEPLQIDWEHKDYRSDRFNISRVANLRPTFPLKDALELLRTNPRLIDKDGIGTFVSKVMTIPVDKAAVIKAGLVAPEDSANIVDEMQIKLGNSVTKSELMFLDILANNDWTRPIHVATTVGSSFYPSIDKYTEYVGLTKQLIPLKTFKNSQHVNTTLMYDNMMNKFEWGGIKNPKVYLDENHLRMAHTLRLLMSSLATSLIEEGQTAQKNGNEQVAKQQLSKAQAVVEKALVELPSSKFGKDYSLVEFAELEYKLGNMAQGDSLMNEIADQKVLILEYCKSVPARRRLALSRDTGARYNLYILQNIARTCQQYKRPMAKEVIDKFNQYISIMD